MEAHVILPHGYTWRGKTYFLCIRLAMYGGIHLDNLDFPKLFLDQAMQCLVFGDLHANKAIT